MTKRRTADKLSWKTAFGGTAASGDGYGSLMLLTSA